MSPAPREAERPLTIALASIEYPPDRFSAGIGSYAKALARLLHERGHRVHVVTRGTDREELTEEEGVFVHRLLPGRPELPENLSPGPIVRLLARSLPAELAYRRKVVTTLTRLVRQEGVDLVEAADHMAETLGYDPTRFPKVPFVVRLHTPLAVTERLAPNIPETARLGIRLLERRLLRKATHLTSPSASATAVIMAEMGLDLPVATYPNPPSYAAQARDPGVQEEPGMVLFVGRLNTLKGVDLLARAIPRVLEVRPDARFVFAGADNIPYGGFPSVSRYLLSLLPSRAHHAIAFTGHLLHDELRDLYPRATLCVFPSRFESFGYTCLEAMGFGKAIVGSNSGGMAEMLDGGAGLLFTPPDVDELTEKILRLLNDPELRRDLGARARRRAAEAYGQEAVMDQVEEFYRRAIAERSLGPA
ncbi:MAG TPA: glycosyltransferase family 4 protein [Trueperaceae bacterium]